MAYPKDKNPFKEAVAGQIGRIQEATNLQEQAPYNQIDELNHRIAELEAQLYHKDAELLKLYRQLDAARNY